MRKSHLFIAYLFITFHCFAQQYPFVHYTPKDGLVNSRVRKAFQDSKGRMYFMTFGGLSVYDGARFTNYTVQNGLAADMINDIIELGDDSLWIACNTQSLNYLRHGKVRTLRTSDGIYPTINKFIRCKDGTIYVVADEGLFRFGHNRFERMSFTNRHGADAGKFLVDAIEWNDLLVLLSDNGLSNLGPGNLFAYNMTTHKLIAESERGYLSGIEISPDHQICVVDGIGNVQRLDTVALLNHRVEFSTVSAPYNRVGPGTSVIYFDSKKNLWALALHNKIIKIDSAGTRKEFSMDNGMSSNDFSDIFLDKEGSLWITMNTAGVDKLVNDNIEKYDDFMHTLVSSIYTDEKMDSVFIYSVFAKKMFIVQKDKITERQLSARSAAAASMLVYSGKIYMPNGKDVYLLPQPEGTNTFMFFNDTAERFIGTVYVDPYQNLITTGSDYITVLRHDSVLSRYRVRYPSDQVALDKKGRLWIASRGNDFFVLKIDPGKSHDYLQLLKKFNPDLPELSARSITVDQFSNVWVGTRYHGLYCFRFDDQLNITAIQQFTIREGMSDNFITYLSCDKENNIWASTSSGIDKITYTGDKVNIENITKSHNIYEFIVKTMVSKDGVAWSYTADGNLIKIGKSNHASSFTPALVITGLKIGNTPADSLSTEAAFSYKQNNLSIAVAAPSFYDERQIKYSYLLQGSGNDQWSDPSVTSTFNFINLNPGKYILKVRATFPGNRYEAQTIDYAFIIHPPWWQTWWFRIIAGIISIGFLIIGFRYYYQNKLRQQRIAAERQQAVEKERTRIATDIHDDLGSGLSRIRYLGEMVKLKTSQQQDILPEIEKISVFSDEMVDKMNEIVWALNEKNDSLEAIVSYTRSFAAEYLSNNGLLSIINLPEYIPDCIIKGETRRNIFLSVKECLHNIIKHAGATETIVTFSIKDQLIISIHDDGKGINWDRTRPFSNGIMNIKKRMKEAGGTVDFKNEKGTTVVLKIPLPPTSPSEADKNRI